MKNQQIEKVLAKIFPTKISSVVLGKINFSQLNEIRLRAGRPILVLLGGLSYFLSEEGISNNVESGIICTKQDVENIVFRASECSIYAVNEQIKKGFLTVEGG